MTTSEITAIADRLAKFNEWRRGADIPQPDPAEIGADIEFAAHMLRSIAGGSRPAKETAAERGERLLRMQEIGMTYAQLAKTEGVSVSTINVVLANARSRRQIEYADKNVSGPCGLVQAMKNIASWK